MNLSTELLMQLREVIEERHLTSIQVREMLKEMHAGRTPTPRRGTPHASPVKRLTDIVRTYTCATCGSRWTHTVRITDNETICTSDARSGQTVIADARSGPYQLDSWVHTCDRCVDFVSRLSREELERAYIISRRFTPLPKEK